MSEHIQAIYQNGVFQPLQSVALPEGKIVEIEVHSVSENKKQELTNAEKVKVFDEWMENLNPNTPNLTDEQISRESIYEEQIQRQL